MIAGPLSFHFQIGHACHFGRVVAVDAHELAKLFRRAASGVDRDRGQHPLDKLWIGQQFTHFCIDAQNADFGGARRCHP